REDGTDRRRHARPRSDERLRDAGDRVGLLRAQLAAIALAPTISATSSSRAARSASPRGPCVGRKTTGGSASRARLSGRGSLPGAAPPTLSTVRRGAAAFEAGAAPRGGRPAGARSPAWTAIP